MERTDKENLEKLNPTKEPLTVEKLKTLLGHELKEEVVEKILIDIKALVNIIVDHQFKQELGKRKEDANQKQAA